MVKVINPATLEVIGEWQEDSASQIQEKFSKAQSAQKKWQEEGLSKRTDVIGHFSELLQKNQERLARLLTEEMGKPICQSRAEISATPERIQFFMDQSPKAIQEEIVLDIKGKIQEKITLEPLGVIAHISVWNYPFFVGLNVLIPALLMGNAVLYKPSEYTTLTGRAILDLFQQAGIPEGVISGVFGKGKTGAQLLKLPLNGVFFTGSYGTGKKISEERAAYLSKIQLELGGKDPAFVCDDLNEKNLKAAAHSLADGAFYNAGQSCCSVERIYVHKKVYDDFLKEFVSAVKSFKMGNPLDENVYLGPLTRKEQISVLENQIKDALQKGGKLILGGKKDPDLSGYYFQPTIITATNHTMSVMKEESFGPIIGIQRVKNDQEALELMNDTEYGLTATVYCTDQKRAEKLLSKINSGTCYWNCCDRVSARLPWSGRKHSGIGTTLSHYGISTFLQPKAWHLKSILKQVL